jgi:hypothetical protein
MSTKLKKKKSKANNHKEDKNEEGENRKKKKTKAAEACGTSGERHPCRIAKEAQAVRLGHDNVRRVADIEHHPEYVRGKKLQTHVN